MIFNIIKTDINLDIILHGKKDGFYFEIKKDDLSLSEMNVVNNIIPFINTYENYILKNKEEEIEINLFVDSDINYGHYLENDYNVLIDTEKFYIDELVAILEKNKTNKL